ncbi:hypothetical protein SeMB42_g04195 [Synchytrium endobioticum]|uniref:Proteasome assembly chaperone 2 n=1 Tax=Synchytrium endobioticum TaxID=286115 RepID=A0A507D1Y4_9FUNG|nr:hypothetical protein SeMB42_g04195 [Synchytrium endobioticum]TPX45315.1 hypothetical protein SeLEV6574_g03931 [Synchytrium endobioticum]
MVASLQFHPLPGFLVSSLERSTIIMPAANSIGNVGQLTMDLLISSLKDCMLVGHLESEFVLPVAGLNAFSDGGKGPLTTALEVFQSTSHPKLTIVQLRSALPPSKFQLFASSLRQWVESIPFQDVIVVSGADATGRADQQIARPRITYFASFRENFCYDDKLKTLDWSKIDEFTESNSSGTGLVKHLVDEFKMDDSRLSLLVLLWYTTEGDNLTDSNRMVSGLNELLDLMICDYKAPPSWKGLFGGQPSTSMFL